MSDIRFHGPGECPPVKPAESSASRVSIALLLEQVKMLQEEIRDRNLELDNWKIDHSRLRGHCEAAEARLSFLLTAALVVLEYIDSAGFDQTADIFVAYRALKARNDLRAAVEAAGRERQE
jgi:hypothetical protein